MANGFDTSGESYVDDDPVAGFDFDEGTQSFDVAGGVDYGSPNIDTGGNETTGEVLSQAGFNQAMNISTKNPYGDQGFFTRVFGIPAQYLDYRPLGIDTGVIANLAYDRYRNPFAGVKDNKVVPGSGIEGVGDLKLREGLSEGEKTRFGEVVSIDRPQGIGETIARTALFGGFLNGRFTPDVAFTIAEPVMKMIATIGVVAEVPNIKMSQDDVTNKQDIKSAVQLNIQAKKTAKELQEEIKESKGLMSKPKTEESK